MKNNKKLIGLIAGLVCLVLCVILLLATCGGRETQPADPSVTEQSTQAPTEATEEPTEEATEPTEETTEPTEEATEPTTSSSGGSTRPGGTGGFTGGGTGTGTGSGSGTTDDTGSSGSETGTDTITVDAPGTEGNPYAELFGTELGSFNTVKIPADQTVFYKIYSVSGTVLTIESADAYVVYNGQTYEAENGAVSVALAADTENKPVPVQIGSRSAEQTSYTVSFTWPMGTLNNPYELTVDQIPGTAAIEQIGAGECLYYNVYGVNGSNLILEDADAYVIYEGVTYTAENGKALVPIAQGDAQKPAFLAVGNGAAEPKAVVLSFDHTYGTAEHPYELQMGEFTTSIEAGNEQGVCYRYTAEAAGVVTLQYVSGTEGAVCEYLLHNQNTYDFRMLSADAVTDEATGMKTVSIQMNEGDVLSLVVSVLPAEDGTYAAAELYSLAAFTTGAIIGDDAAERVMYSVTALDSTGAPVAGLNLSVNVGNTSVTLTTDAEGVACISLSAGTCSIALTEPDGYTASETAFELSAEAPARTVILTKNQEEPGEPDDSLVEYTVSVVDYNGAAQSNVMVQFLKDGAVVALGTTDAEGTARAKLEKGSYTAALAFSAGGCYYDESQAVFAEDSTELRIRVATGLTGETEELYVGTANILYAGGTYVSGMQSNVVHYFLFTPTASGVYRFTTSNPEAVISYWGGTTAFIQDQTDSTDYADNAFTRNVKESNLGGVTILGVTGASECVIEITRIGDAVLDETDIEPEIYEAKTPPTPYTLTLSEGQSLTYVDITGATSDYNLVLGADGYYHLNSADGPIMYVNLGPSAPYVSFYKMLGYEGFGGTSFAKTFRDENGVFLRKEEYTACMCQYVECVDDKGYGVYPMTEDLYYMLRNGGEYKGWWDSTNPSYLFGELEGLNPEIAWMFCCCYVQ